MQYGTVLTWGLFVYSGCACVMFVRRDDEKKKNPRRKEKHKNKHVSSAKRKVRSSVLQVTFLPASSLV